MMLSGLMSFGEVIVQKTKSPSLSLGRIVFSSVFKFVSPLTRFE